MAQIAALLDGRPPRAGGRLKRQFVPFFYVSPLQLVTKRWETCRTHESSYDWMKRLNWRLQSVWEWAWSTYRVILRKLKPGEKKRVFSRPRAQVMKVKCMYACAAPTLTCALMRTWIPRAPFHSHSTSSQSICQQLRGGTSSIAIFYRASIPTVVATRLASPSLAAAYHLRPRTWLELVFFPF